MAQWLGPSHAFGELLDFSHYRMCNINIYINENVFTELLNKILLSYLFFNFTTFPQTL